MSARVELGPPVGLYNQLDGPSEIARWFGALSWSRGSVYVTTFEQIQYRVLLLHPYPSRFPYNGLQILDRIRPRAQNRQLCRSMSSFSPM